MALKYVDGPPAFDLCSQVQDDGLSNKIPGYQKCRPAKVAEMIEREKHHCLQEGGHWSELNHSCTLVEK